MAYIVSIILSILLVLRHACGVYLATDCLNCPMFLYASEIFQTNSLVGFNEPKKECQKVLLT